MQLSLDRARRRHVALVAAGATVVLVASALAASPASAFFVVQRCGGDAINGSGATFAGNAQDAFSSSFRNTAAGCPQHPLIAYTRSGSGRGRGVMGGSLVSDANGVPGVRVNDFRFGVSDEGPSPTSQNNMNVGDVGTPADNGLIRVIPIAAGAVVPTVNYPNVNADGTGATCPIPTDFKITREGFDRLAVPNERLERAWAGVFATWNDFVPGLTALNPACGAKPLVRVVRQDNSGTTFAWKDYLNAAADLPSGSGTDWNPGLTSSSALNRAWPETREGHSMGLEAISDLNPQLGFQTSAVDAACSANYVAGLAPFTTDLPDFPVCRAGPNGNAPSNGNNPQARLLGRTDGSIAYTELAVVVEEGLRMSVTNTDKYAMPQAIRSTGPPGVGGNAASYAEPSVNGNGFVAGMATGGANCAGVPVNNVPAGADPTTSNLWNPVTMVLPTAGYSSCSLTYMLVFDDNAPPYLAIPGNTYDAEERRARALVDYIRYITSTAGQTTLIPNDYSPLPENLRVLAANAAGLMDWDKANIGNRNPNPQTPQTPQTPPTDPGTTPPVTEVPAAPGAPGTAPVNVFTTSSSRLSGTALVSTFQLPGAGRLVVGARGTFSEPVRSAQAAQRRTRTRRITVGTNRTVTVSRAGAVTVRLNLTSAARTALNRGRRIRVTLTSTFTPAGGAARTTTRTLTIRRAARRR